MGIPGSAKRMSERVASGYKTGNSMGARARARIYEKS